MKNCAFDLGDMCSALSTKQCVGCNFCKTKEELKEGRQKAAERLDYLPKKKQIHIARKYYGMNWGKQWS